jgi:hypothetical protein
MSETVRCRQCGWTIAPKRVEKVTLPDGTVAYLHRGGCPDPERKEP